jgi:dihydrodipicolinate synthase/N-acetylneuraminate lyase
MWHGLTGCRCITGTGNIFPKTIARLYTLAVKGLKGDAAALTEALALQDRVARSDFIIVKAGVAGTVGLRSSIGVMAC